MKRFFCVILVFTLFIACTVRPAYAVDVGTVSVALEAFISAALIGLGLSPQAGNNTAFNQFVSNCKEWLQTATIDGLEILSTASGLALSLISPVDGAFYVRKNVIEGIKDWLFDSGSVSVPFVDSSFVLGSVTYTFSKPVHILKAVAMKDGENAFSAFIVALSSSSFSYHRNGVFYGSADSRNGYSYLILSNTSVSSTDYSPYIKEGYVLFPPITRSILEITDSYAVGLDDRSLIVPDGISVSDVVPQVGEDIEITYIDWKELEKQVQEGDGSSEDPTDPTNPAPIPLIPYWPIWSPQFSNPDSTLDDVLQSDVWQSGSDPNWNPGNSGENSESSLDIPSLTIDLRKFFPFCIPFDIYDIFVAFAADPVAPHFQWDIDIWDYTWSIDLDLSAWDEVAAILRRLELLAFIVGLGLVTRDKFLRG